MKYLIIILFTLSVLLSGYGGWYVGTATTQLIETIREVPVERIVRVEVPIEVIKEVPVYIDRFVTKYQQVPIPQKEWQNLDEFLSELPTFTYFTGGCLGIAGMLQNYLTSEGYKVSLAFTWNGYYYGKRVTDAPDGHAGLLVGIHRTYYFYDPETKQVTKLW